MKGSPADPNRIYASQSSSWFGQVIQRSSDGGKTRRRSATSSPTKAPPLYAICTTARSARSSSSRCLHLEPIARRSRHRLCRHPGRRRCSARPTAGRLRRESSLACVIHRPGCRQWQPGAGGMCLHTILLDPTDPRRIYIAISAAGAFGASDGGETWTADESRAHSSADPDPRPRSATACIGSPCIRRVRTCCSCRSTDRHAHAIRCWQSLDGRRRNLPD